MRRRLLLPTGASSARLFPRLLMASDAMPANTLADLGRQFSACMATRPLERSGSQMTIAFAMKRDGSVFGKPRITLFASRGRREDEAALRRLCRAGGRLVPADGSHARARRSDRRPVFTITLGGKGDGA